MNNDNKNQSGKFPSIDPYLNNASIGINVKNDKALSWGTIKIKYTKCPINEYIKKGSNNLYAHFFIKVRMSVILKNIPALKKNHGMKKYRKRSKIL